jgi:uncharacterized membrane protein
LDARIASLCYFLTPLVPAVILAIGRPESFIRFHAYQALALWLIYIVPCGFIIATGVGLIGSANSSGSDNAVLGAGIAVASCGGLILMFFAVLWFWGMGTAYIGLSVRLPLAGRLAMRWAGLQP